MEIKKYIDKIKNLKRIFLILRYLLLSLNLLIGGFVLSALVDEILPLPIVAFHLYWFVIMFILLIFLIFLIIRLVQSPKDVYLIFNRLLNEKGIKSTKDELINAYELEQSIFLNKTNYSDELAKKFLDIVKEKIQIIKPEEVVDFNKIIKVIPLNVVLIILVLILYFVPPNILKENVYKILLTRSPEILGLFVFPKNIRVPLNSSCEIKLVVDKNYHMYRPILFIKQHKENNWLKITDMFTEYAPIGKIYKYKIENISEKIYYKIKFRGVSTKIFIIKPILFPTITQLKIEVFPPKYTGMKSYILESFNEAKYLYGSKLNFSGTVNKDIKKINMWFNGKYYGINFNKKNEFFGNIVVKEDSELWFEIEDVYGIKSVDMVKYRINIFRDESPTVELLSPENDIIVEKNSKIPIVYSAKDDFGLSKINLVLTLGKENRTHTLETYDNLKREIFNEYIFDTSRYNLNYGDEVFYKIVVYDNDTIFGPKKSETKLQKIEIFSFEKKHELLQNKIKKFNEKLLDNLAREIELKENIDNLLTTSQINLTKIEKVLNLKNIANENLAQLKMELSNISSEMMTDPYFSIDTYLEFKNLEKSFDELFSEINPKILSDIASKNFVDALNRQQSVIDTLERVAFINDELLKRQNMSNISALTKEMVSSTKELLSEMAQTKGTLTEEQKMKLENIFKQINEKLSQLTSMLKMNPEEILPQEFINRRDVKNIDIAKTQNMLENISSAISKGDIDSIINYAQQLLKELDSMTKLLESASSEVLSNKIGDYENKIDNLINELDNIIKNQEDIYTETQKLNDYAVKQLLNKQVQKFEIIRAKVEKILEEINNLNSTEIFMNTTYRFQYLNNVYEVSKKMNEIISELDRKIIINSSSYVKESLKQWEKNIQIVEKLDSTNFAKFIEKNKEVYSILEQLNNIFEEKIDIEYSQEQLKTNNNLVQKQSTTKGLTKDFTKKMKDVGRNSYLITPRHIESANISYSQMAQSENKLLDKNFSEAIKFQKIAIDELNKIKEFFNENKGQMQKIKSGLGQSMSGKQQYKSGMFIKSQGLLVDRIKLPSVNDYIPPKEFREDIIKSLSEKYPVEDNKDIQKYYKELLR